MANYVMGSYYAPTLRDAPPQPLAPMARQFRMALANTPEVAQASPQRRRKLHEELSLFGVALGARYALENHSDPAKRAKL